MQKNSAAIFGLILLFLFSVNVSGEQLETEASGNYSLFTKSVELLRYEKEHSSARIGPAKVGERKGVAIIFEGTGDLHYYAKQESAPGGYYLKIKAESEGFEFGQAEFGKWEIFFDNTQGKNIEVYAGNFAVFIPIESVKEKASSDVDVKISGIACTSTICLTPFEKTLQTKVDYSGANLWKEVKLESAEEVGAVAKGRAYPVLFAFGLALVAGVTLNIMPCVWPVLPIIVMRIVEQAKDNKARSIAMGLCFCLGILLFFACLGGANIVLQLVYGTVLQWGDQFRNPAFVAGMSLLLVVMALFMFGVFAIGLPASVTGKSSSGKGFTGSVGMGFLAAILSTPCSFGILAAAFAWAQAQKLLLGTLAIMFIGVGMAIPYAILTSMPGLLKRLPKAGKWMELFKQGIGFVLLLIAVKLIAALPFELMTGILYFSIVIGFGLWMWGGWVSFNTKMSRKWLIRTIAVILILAGGFLFLPTSKAELIDWQGYDANLIRQARKESRPVLIKFTADWCFSCQVVEKTVYSKKDIADLIKEKDVLAIKADTTESDFPATVALKNVYREPGVPVTIVYVPGHDEDLRWRGIIFADELKKVLESIGNK